MNKHHGQIVEYTLRKKGMNISELAIALKVNRRTIYNWFNLPRLRVDVIFRIGVVIRHNFSIEFPELFLSEQFDVDQKPKIQEELLANNIWKDKYLALLENYNETLTKALKGGNAGDLFLLLPISFELVSLLA